MVRRALLLVVLVACSEAPPPAPKSSASLPPLPVVTVAIPPVASSAPARPTTPADERPTREDALRPPNVVLQLETVPPNEWSGGHANAPVAPSGIWGDDKHVLAVGAGKILRSGDRGANFTMTRGPSDYPVVWGASIDDVYAGGASIVRSTDRGVSWSPAGRLPGSVYGLWGSGPADVWAVGGAPAFVARTSDHGATWTPVKLAGKPLEWLYDVSGAGADVWIVGKRRGASGTESAIFHSGDHGKTFGEVAPPKPGMTTNEQSRKVCVAPSGAVHVAMSYSLYTTRDKGKTWKLATPVNTEVLALACRDKQVVVGGRNHALFASKDDGATFQPLNLDGPLDQKLVAAQAAFLAPGGEVYVGFESYDPSKGAGTLMRREP